MKKMKDQSHWDVGTAPWPKEFALFCVYSPPLLGLVCLPGSKVPLAQGGKRERRAAQTPLEHEHSQETRDSELAERELKD